MTGRVRPCGGGAEEGAALGGVRHGACCLWPPVFLWVGQERSYRTGLKIAQRKPAQDPRRTAVISSPDLGALLTGSQQMTITAHKAGRAPQARWGLITERGDVGWGAGWRRASRQGLPDLGAAVPRWAHRRRCTMRVGAVRQMTRCAVPLGRRGVSIGVRARISRPLRLGAEPAVCHGRQEGLLEPLAEPL